MGAAGPGAAMRPCAVRELGAVKGLPVGPGAAEVVLWVGNPAVAGGCGSLCEDAA